MGYGKSNLDGRNMPPHTGKSSSSTSHCCLISWLKRGHVRSNGQFEVLSTRDLPLRHGGFKCRSKVYEQNHFHARSALT